MCINYFDIQYVLVFTNLPKKNYNGEYTLEIETHNSA